MGYVFRSKYIRFISVVLATFFFVSVINPSAYASLKAKKDLKTSFQEILADNLKVKAQKRLQQGLGILVKYQTSLVGDGANEQLKKQTATQLIDFLQNQSENGFYSGERINNEDILLSINELLYRALTAINQTNLLDGEAKDELITGVTAILQAERSIANISLKDDQGVLNTLQALGSTLETAKLNKLTEEINKAELEFSKGDDRISSVNGSDAARKYLETWRHAKVVLDTLGINYGGDTDRDSIPDYIELSTGANPLLADTDNDRIGDAYEITHLLAFSAPNKADTDGDGIPDGQEDIDDDGLTNNQEMTAGTNPLNPDTDKDGLSDEQEIINKTNPCQADSDNDGLTDQAEAKFHINPNLADSDGNGIKDGDGTYSDLARNEQLGVAVEITGTGDISKGLTIRPTTSEYFNKQEVPGLIGNPVDITTKGSFSQAKLTFTIPDELPPGVNKSDLKIFYWNKEKLTFLPLDNQVLDETRNQLSATTNHFSEFLIIDTQAWAKAWRASLNKGDSGSIDQSPIDLVLLLDATTHMDTADPQDVRKQAASQLIDALQPGDRVSVIAQTYSAYDVRPYVSLTSDFQLAKTELSYLRNWNLSFSMYDTLINAYTQFRLYSQPGRKKIAIIFTDGNYYETAIYPYFFGLLRQFQFDTVGMGNNVKEQNLKPLSDYSGGQYYNLKSTEEIPQFQQQLLKDVGRIQSAPIDSDQDGISDTVEIDGMRVGDGRIVKTDPNNADTDGDGLLDGYEIGGVLDAPYGEYYQMYSDPRSPDTDKDTLSDYEEDEIGTSSFAWDTDYDRLSDALEMQNDFDPSNSNPDGDTRPDYEEFTKVSDPFEYDKTVWEKGQEFALGFVFGDAGENFVTVNILTEDNISSIYYLAGWLGSGFLLVGDIRDTVASLVRLDFAGAFLYAIAMVPAVGDYLGTTKICVKFVAHNTEMMPVVIKFIAKNFEEDATVLAKTIDAISSGAHSALVAKGANLGDLKQLEKAGNDLKLLDESGVTFASKTLDREGFDEINGLIKENWGTGLTNGKYAEAFAIESAVKNYEKEYDILWVSRGKGIVHGPDIIAKNKVTGEALIIEAKGTSAGKVLNAVEGKGKSWLGATIGDVDTYYLTRVWLKESGERRYLTKLRELKPEAYELMNEVIAGRKNYKASVVYGGSHNSKLTFGRGLDMFADILKSDVTGIEFVKINYNI
jgi:Mg-chelatase subunit ChlD